MRHLTRSLLEVAVNALNPELNVFEAVYLHNGVFGLRIPLNAFPLFYVNYTLCLRNELRTLSDVFKRYRLMRTMILTVVILGILEFSSFGTILTTSHLYIYRDTFNISQICI